MDLNQIISAREKMKGIIHQTPLDFSQTFTDMSHNEVYLKLENLQKTGSFKVRGSINKLTSLSKEELSKGSDCRFGRKSCTRGRLFKQNVKYPMYDRHA